MAPGERTVVPTPDDMPKMGPQEYFDLGTTGPSRNFVYDMEVYRFFVRDEWTEILAHDADGRVTAGSFAALEEAQIAGREIKVGIRDLGADLANDGAPSVAHETFTLVGSGFVHVRAGLYVTLTHPLVRVAGAIPLRYRSGNWDVAWVFLRTDGQAQVRRIDPYTRAWTRPSGAARLPLVRTVNRHHSGPPDQFQNRAALKASCNLRPMLISHCPWSREGL